jgi:hypothetical protein
MPVQCAAGAYTRIALSLGTQRQGTGTGGLSARMRFDVSWNERKEVGVGRRTLGEHLLPELRVRRYRHQLAQWREGFVGRTDGWGLGERTAMVARMSKTASSENEDVREAGQ